MMESEYGAGGQSADTTSGAGQTAMPADAPVSTSPAPPKPASPNNNPAPGLDQQLDADDTEITRMESQIKTLQQDVIELKAHKTALAAFSDERKASSSALGQAKNKATTERTSAATLILHTADIGKRLAAEGVRATDQAVKEVEAQASTLRTKLVTLQAELIDRATAETDAKAASTNAKAVLTAAKRSLSDLAKAIDAQTARVKVLNSQATDAEAKDQYDLAYLVLVDLATAVAQLDALVAPKVSDDLQAATQRAWDHVAATRESEAKAIRATQSQADAVKQAQDTLTTSEKNRRKSIEDRKAELEKGAGSTAAAAVSSA